jgi:ATP-binding cassette, subfamily B, multidrug efflux pump
MAMNPLKPFQSYLRPYRRMVILGLIFLLSVQVIQTAIPMILKFAIDEGKAYLDARQLEQMLPPTWTGTATSDLAAYGILIGVLGLIQWVLNFGMRWNFTALSRYVERDVRALYVRHLVKLPLAFFNTHQVGDLMARATNDVEAIQRFLHHAFRMSLTGILTFFLSLALMCSIDWYLAILSLIPMPVMVLCARMMAGRMRRGYRSVQEQFGVMSSCIQENLSGMRVVKAFSRRLPEIEKFSGLNDDYVERNRLLINLRSWFYPFTFFLNGVSMVVILWLGGLRVIEGSLSLGAFVAFNAYLIRMSRPMMMLGRMVDEHQRAAASLTRIESITYETPQVLETTDDGDRYRGEIEFRNVSFSYDGSPALEDVSVKVPAGSTLAIVGRVGSGKSTLARLIPRLMRADEGEVLIDGIPVEEIPITTIRNLIGYVPQDTFLFSDTIFENVSLGADDSTGPRVDRATQISQLTKDLEVMPQKMDTIVGERGVTLSGGQKQRTALARAVIREPKIMILDDAMSSVDTRTEEAILTGLRDVMANRTTILIAHRISTVKDADHILVMDEGQIVEQGDHDSLVAQDGIYGEMFRRQHLAAELDEM